MGDSYAIDLHWMLTQNKLLNNINLKLNKGETLGIVGESGSGKTLMGLSITGLLDSSIFEVVSGEIIYNNKNLYLINAVFRL